MKVAVAMSGGVDSSTVAGLLVEHGHEVIGLTMKTHAEVPHDAGVVARHLGIAFHLLDYTDVFHAIVKGPFAEAYASGRTPNPCVECNDKVKFGLLFTRAKLLGADVLATGHYARIGEGPTLMRGADAKKDQSYFLYRLGTDQLAQLMFPIGGMHKTEVRAHAARLGLPVAQKQESQEICFVGAEGYAKTVESICGRGGKAGNIVDKNGTVLGRHTGVHHFTYGQRKGLRIAASEPLYVTGIDGATGNVRVGGRGDLFVDDIVIAGVRWTHEPPQPDEVVLVQQRYRELPKQVRVSVSGERARLTFVSPEARGAPGQAAVIYRGSTVLGGGTIAA